MFLKSIVSKVQNRFVDRFTYIFFVKYFICETNSHSLCVGKILKKEILFHFWKLCYPFFCEYWHKLSSCRQQTNFIWRELTLVLACNFKTWRGTIRNMSSVHCEKSSIPNSSAVRFRSHIQGRYTQKMQYVSSLASLPFSSPTHLACVHMHTFTCAQFLHFSFNYYS